MSDQPKTPEADEQARQFAQQAAEPPQGLVAEFVDFVLHNKKWWLTPIILVLLAVGVLIAIGSSGAGPLIYTLF